MFTLIYMLFLISFILLLIPLFTSFKSLFNREMTSPFECGFDPYHSSRIPFSLQFFLIAVIFLIFDIEITLLLPLPMTLTMNYPYFYFYSSMIFIFVLLLGTYYEWHKGALNWSF